MKRTPIMAGVLAVVALALLIAACGSDPTPTSAPAATTPPAAVPTATSPPQPTAPPSTVTPPSTATPAQVPTQVAPAPTQGAPTPAPTPEEPEAADPSDAYFAMDRVLEVSIEIAEEDWDTLRHQARTFEDLMAEIEKYNLSRPFAGIYTWFSATVTIDGETHTEVGVRKKGFLGSQSDTKPSLKLRYDKYVDDQSLGGVMERMTLNNSIQDPSMINTCLSYQVFAAAGLPSPRCNFATVTVNGKELGLYVHLEELKKPFLARHFDSAEGNLYEGTVSDFTPSHRGTMKKKTNEDEDDWSDIDAVMATLQDPSDAGLVTLGEIVDLDRFLSFWATEVLVGHWDGYTGDRNNYHFYREPDGKFVFIPWGADDTFHLKDDPNPFDNISDPPPSVLALSAIPNRLYNIPEWRSKYAERLKEIVDTAWDEEELLSSVDTMAAIVQEHALPGERATAAADTERVRKFILKRKGEILADLTPEPPDWPEPEEADSVYTGESLTVELQFETTWGSLDSPNPGEEGSITSYWVNDVEMPAGEFGAAAGLVPPEEAANLGPEEAAVIAFIAPNPDSTFSIIAIWMPVDLLVSGANLTIGEGDVVGASWEESADGMDLYEPIPISGGLLELVEVGTEPRDTISGRLQATIGRSPSAAGAAAADGVESFELRFETTWESNRSVNPLAEGTVYELNEDGEWVAATRGEAGATAGPASPQEEADIGVKDAALFTVMGLYPDGAIRGVTFWMPVDHIAAGATLIIGVDAGVGGAIWTIPAGKVEPEGFIPVTAGSIYLAKAGTEPGAAIASRLYASFGDASVPGSDIPAQTPAGVDGRFDAGEIKLRFETVWGSNQNANPFEEGRVTYFWRMNGIGAEQPLEGLAAIAGHASAEESAGFGIENAASVTILGFGAEGSIEGLTLALPLAQLASGASLAIGEDAQAVVWKIPAGASAPEQIVPAYKGRVEFAEASTEPGATVAGYFHATFSLDNPLLPTSVKPPAIADIGLVINEVAAKGDPLDWFELYNATNSVIDLTGYLVADDLTDAAKRVAFPSGTTIAPGEYLQVEVDSDNWAGFKLGGDEELGVWTSEGVLVDSVDWDEGDSGEGKSYARVPDGNGEFKTVGNPTPGAANQAGN